MSAPPLGALLRRHGSLLALGVVPLVALAASMRHALGTPGPGAAKLTLTPAVVVLAAIGGVGVLWLGALVLGVHRRRHDDDEMRHIVTWQPSARAQLVALLVVLPLIAVPVALAVAVAGHHTAPADRTTPTVQSVSPNPAPKRSVAAHGTSGPGLVTVLVVAGVVVIAGTAGLLAHRRGTGTDDSVPPHADTMLQRAVDLGVQQAVAALDTTDDVRLAIMRCYTAMQSSLDQAGLPRSPVRTPTELLDAAVVQGLLPAGPATALTRLFERARFSSEALGALDRDAARDALDALRAAEPAR